MKTASFLIFIIGEVMEVLYEDKDIIVVVKPVGILSEETSDGKGLVNLLKEHTKGEIYPIHRLDKGVGGVMVYSKNKKSAASLSSQVQERTFEKEYIAKVYGKMEEKEGIMEDLLFKDARKNKTFVVKRERKGVKKAKLSYRVLSEGIFEDKVFSVVSVKLYTGRSHQIRVQFASRKHPLLGDRKYGASDSVKDIALFSRKIGFYHPETKEWLFFEKESDIYKLFE